MKLLTVQETVDRVNAIRRYPISINGVWKWIYRGKIPHVKIGSATMILESELEKFLSTKKQSSKLLDCAKPAPQ